MTMECLTCNEICQMFNFQIQLIKIIWQLLRRENELSMALSFQNLIWCSILVYPYKIVNFEPTDWTFFQVFTASNACCVMFTRHIHAIFVILVANNACIWMSLLTDVSCLDSADISLTRTYLKYSLVRNFKQWTDFWLIRKSLPGSICCSHVFDIKLIVQRCDSGMDIR